MLRIEILGLLMKKCRSLKKVCFIENWEANSEHEIESFWKYIKENNIDLDAGEQEFFEVTLC